jgi:hypothetical protein
MGNFYKEYSPMKRLLFLLVAVLVLDLAGCQEPSRYSMIPGSLEVIVEGDGEFPEFLVGKWVGDKDGWGFIFESGGKILVAKISMARVEIVPGVVKTMPTISDEDAIFVPGDWLVLYSPDSRELTVNMAMNYIKIEMGDQVFQGKTRDIVTGTISEDGELWRTIVSSFPEYEGFPTGPEDVPFVSEVNFTKVEQEK